MMQSMPNTKTSELMGALAESGWLMPGRQSKHLGARVLRAIAKRNKRNGRKRNRK